MINTKKIICAIVCFYCTYSTYGQDICCNIKLVDSLYMIGSLPFSGQCNYYFKNGNIKETIDFRNGQFDKITTYYKDGNKKRELNYFGGIQIDKTFVWSRQGEKFQIVNITKKKQIIKGFLYSNVTKNYRIKIE